MKTLKQLLMTNNLTVIGDSAITSAVNNLPLELKQVIELHYFQNLSRKQIAKELNWSYSKVHNKITRGVTLLKAELNPGYFDEMRQLATTLYRSAFIQAKD